MANHSSTSRKEQRRILWRVRMTRLANGRLDIIEDKISMTIVNQATMKEEQPPPIQMNQKQRNRAVLCIHGTGSTKSDRWGTIFFEIYRIDADVVTFTKFVTLRLIKTTAP
jgi:hypothetical protein